MFPLEQGAFEMLLIGAIALIVVGPKDLPVLMRKLGQFTARMRGMAAEFRASFDEMARQSELDELRKEVDALRSGAYTAPVSAEIDKHLYDYDQTPTAYPSPPPETELPLLSPRDAGEEKKAKPRARKAVPDAAAAPKPRAPRKPRAKAAAPSEAEG